MISAAIIGCGAIARKRHAPACASHRDVGLSGFYDPAVQNAEDLAKRYGGKTYGSREELLSDENFSLTEYSDTLIYRIVERVTVLSKKQIGIRFIGGLEIIQVLE